MDDNRDRNKEQKIVVCGVLSLFFDGLSNIAVCLFQVGFLKDRSTYF